MGILDTPGLSLRVADGRYARAMIARTRENAIAALGDSRTDMVSDNTSAITQYAANGWMTWARLLSGQRFYFDDSLNFGTSGDTIAQAALRVPNVIASGVSRCFVLIGTNDLAITSIADMIDQWTNRIILPLQRAGVQPIAILEYPRIGISATALGVKNQFNDYIRRFSLSQGAIPASVRLICVDIQDYMENYASGTGSALADRLYDGTHPSPIGAYWMGKAISEVINVLYPPVRFPCSPADLYDATKNPRGMINVNPALSGTGGLLVNSAGITPTGQVATNYKLYRGAGTSASVTFAGSKENPRTDGPTSGERQRVTVNITGAGSSVETYILQATTNPSQYVAAGSWVELSCAVEFAADPVHLIGLELQMAEIGPASPRQAVDMSRTVVNGTTYPMPSIAFNGRLRTPPFQLQAGVTAISSYIRMVFDASSGVASGDLKIADFAMRPVV